MRTSKASSQSWSIHLAQRLQMPPNLIFASPGRRLAAALIDTMLTLPAWPASMGIIGILQGGDVHNTDFLIRTLLLGFLIQMIYFTVQEMSEHQATLGKRILGIQILDPHGKRLDFERVCLRHLVRVLNVPLLGIGMALSLRSPKVRTLHDLVTGTAVVSATATPGQARTATHKARKRDSLFTVASCLLCAATLGFVTGPVWTEFHRYAEINRALASARPYLAYIKDLIERNSTLPSDYDRLSQMFQEKFSPGMTAVLFKDASVGVTLRDVNGMPIQVIFKPMTTDYMGQVLARWECFSGDLSSWMLPNYCRSSSPDDASGQPPILQGRFAVSQNTSDRPSPQRLSMLSGNTAMVSDLPHVAAPTPLDTSAD